MSRFLKRNIISEDTKADSKETEQDLKGGVAVVALAGFVSGHNVEGALEFCFGPSFYHRIAYYIDFLNKYIGLDTNACMVDAEPIPLSHGRPVF